MKYRPFKFFGELEASKSLMNRWLIVKSFDSSLKLKGSSQCEDVAAMQKACAELLSGGREVDAREAGTVFRFIAFRLSREEGEFLLKGSPRLLQRPQQPLLDILEGLGVNCEITDLGLKINSDGWKSPNKSLNIDRSLSSQFASGLALSAWNLPFDLEFSMSGEKLSEPYWQMTLEVLREVGMEIREKRNSYLIPAGQKIKKVREVIVEPDMSSAFAVAALASIAGTAHIYNIPEESLQPDGQFVEIMSRMGASVYTTGGKLVVEKTKFLKAIECDLSSSPDLFPVLAVLCALAHGRSHLYGAPHLIHKESDRIQAIGQLFVHLGVVFELKEDGLVVEGPAKRVSSFRFNPQQDHRLVMAAGVAYRAGIDVTIENPEVVEKSFPQYQEVALGAL